VWTGCIWLRYGPLAGFCENGNELSASIKGEEFLELLKEDSHGVSQSVSYILSTLKIGLDRHLTNLPDTLLIHTN